MEPKELIALATSLARPFTPSGGCRSATVAAALVTAESSVFTGVCVDTACSLGFCAEHAAIAEMLKARQSRVQMIAAVNKDGAVLPPCGRCRNCFGRWTIEIGIPGWCSVWMKEPDCMSSCPGDELQIYGNMVLWGVVKTRLEIPDDLFREMKAAAALRGTRLRDFVTDAISGHLARIRTGDLRWSQRLPPPPKVARSELRRIHELIQEESERIDVEDLGQ